MLRIEVTSLNYLMCSSIIEAAFSVCAVAEWLVFRVATSTQRVTVTICYDIAIGTNQRCASHPK
jgi:hypothetical protein